MIHASSLFTALLTASLAAGSPVIPRAVDKLNDSAFKEAQQRDDTAVRALANTQIKTFDGRCLFVDALSGDFRANLTPLQIEDCGGNRTGLGFDVITEGKHSNQQGQALVVSTLTQACLSFDPRRPADSQVHLFSCGGRADGGGEVSNSQLFAFDGKEQGAIALTPQNSPGKCLVSAGNKVVIDDCDDKDDKQKFTFDGDADKGNGDNDNEGGNENQQPELSSSAARVTTGTATKSLQSKLTSAPSSIMSLVSGDTGSECSLNVATVVNTVTVTMPAPSGTGDATSVLHSTIFPTETGAPGKKTVKNKENSGCNDGNSNNNDGSLVGGCSGDNTTNNSSTTNSVSATTTRAAGGQHTANPTTEVPVSRGDTKLNPTAAAVANQFDTTARRAPESGKHNDARAGKALLVSVLTNGCLNFDSRRQQGDTVTMFSCGGRADGEGETTTSQLFPFDGTNDIVLQPSSDDGKFCLVAGKDRLDSASCDKQKDQVFELVEVLESTADQL
ncbi:hypothetical protein LLEC1_07300 [Akanthomyces lecanii]|uniref:Uncharacterized protein n=1 Tax=Cordyceps confragosa TaxID=2714763 RepID=A0A179IE32_CORDF|nr:hypothetical protein LLEC1_07300 [Akanthomyces lecanii]